MAIARVESIRDGLARMDGAPDRAGMRALAVVGPGGAGRKVRLRGAGTSRWWSAQADWG